MSAHDHIMRDIHLEDLQKAEEALAACAYWAANGLHSQIGNVSVMTVSSSWAVRTAMLENILKESKEYAESEPDRDSNVMFEGFEYSYTPVGGFPETEEKRDD